MMRALFARGFATLGLILLSSLSWAQLSGLAAFGDSLTDEYFEDGYGYARSWYQQVHEFRQPIGGPLGSWGEPRRNGYEFNWARFGADSFAMRSAYFENLTLVRGQRQSGRTTHASMYIGHNDLAPWRGNFEPIYFGEWSDGEIEQLLDAIVANVASVTDSLIALGLPPVLSSPIDLTPLPWTRNAGYTNVPGLERVSRVFGRLSAKLRAYARSRRIVFVDMVALSREIFGTPSAPRTTLLVGGNAIQVRDNGFLPINGFVEDGIHHHSVLQGIKANAFIAGLNKGYGVGMRPFSEREIVTNAGLIYDRDTLPFDPSRFVTSYVLRANRTPIAVP